MDTFFQGILSQWQGYGWEMGPGMMGGGYGLFGGIFMLAFWILIIVALALFIRWLVISSKSGDKRAEESALDILKKRYVRGEISKEEYEEIKRVIL